MEDVSWPTGHDNARIKTLGKLKERWSVKPTKRCVVAVNQIWYLICDLINIKSGKISMFSGRSRGRVGETCWRMIKRHSGKNLLEFFVFLVAIVP